MSFGVGATGRAAIAGLQGGSDADLVGLAFFIHNSSTGSADAAEAMRITSSGNVGIGNTSPDSVLTAVNAASTAALRIGLNNTSNNFMDADNNIFRSGAGVERAQITNSEVVFNDPGNDVDFRVESNGNTHMLFVDAGPDRDWETNA